MNKIFKKFQRQKYFIEGWSTNLSQAHAHLSNFKIYSKFLYLAHFLRNPISNFLDSWSFFSKEGDEKSFNSIGEFVTKIIIYFSWFSGKFDQGNKLYCVNNIETIELFFLILRLVTVINDSILHVLTGARLCTFTYRFSLLK